ncbi:MAG TPA: ABC transporter permease [Trebonia sp.]
MNGSGTVGLGLRLAVNGGREAVTRLVILAVAVGLGVGLLLTAVAATNAVTSWNNRHAWFWTGTQWAAPGPATGVAPLWWHPASDIYDGQTISRFDVAATGASSPVPPGLSHDPAPGTYDASPALAALLRSVPADQLADRYPGHLAGIIGDAALPSPNSLVVVVGRTPAQLATTVGSVKVTAIATTVGNIGGNVTIPPAGKGHRPQLPPNFNPNGLKYTPADTGLPASGTDLLLSVVALAILLPVLIFIGTATRLSAARREERFAAMRLVGATRTQVSALAAVESTAAALLGVAAGFAIFFGLRVPVAGIPFVGQPFFPGQLTLSLSDVIVVAAGVPVAAAVAARLALRRVNISPLGVTRRVTPKPPGAWRVVPLLLGLAELGFWEAHGHPASIPGQIQAFVTSFALIIIGLFLAGPWLTMAAARLMARWTSRPGTLIAARRIGDDPRAAFRSVSGLVLALLVTTVATIAITTQDAKDPTRFGSIAESHVLSAQISASNAVAGGSAPGGRSGTANPGPAAPAAPLAAQLSAVPGVQGVLVVRAVPGLTIPGRFENLGVNAFGVNADGSVTPIPAGVVSCAQLATVPALGRCPAGAATAEFPADGFNGPLGFNANVDTYTWPAAKVPLAGLDALSVDGINVTTNGATATVEQARTLLEASVYPTVSPPSTYADIALQDNSQNSGYQQLADVVILVSLAIAGCTLAAGIAAGLAERKRPFSLLRLTGARLSTLRAVVALEGAVPLLTVAVVAIGTGFGAAAMYATEAQNRPMVAPGLAYYLLTVGGIIVSLAIIAATFPILTRITGPEVARND